MKDEISDNLLNEIVNNFQGVIEGKYSRLLSTHHEGEEANICSSEITEYLNKVS